jgi:hypothetical protein
MLHSILDATFRANPDYEIILYDRLSLEHKQMLGSLQDDPDLYGILYPRPTHPHLSIKSVCRETALLFFTLQQPGKLPAYLTEIHGPGANEAIARLVLDGILEIDWYGVFVSGSAAYERVYQTVPIAVEQNRIVRLSISAVQYAQSLDIQDSLKLSARMYFYNRQPISPAWQQLFSTPEAVLVYIGAHMGATRSMLARHWKRLSLAPPNHGWIAWRVQHANAVSSRTASSYKLYVSPACTALRPAFEAAVVAGSACCATSIKIGGDAAGLLRPDKIVLYFDTLDDVQQAANQIYERLSGCPVHGVPFTAELVGDGMLSWGMDPPDDQQALAWHERQTWRLWITNRLATALIMARQTRDAPIVPWQFALERLRLEGIDTTTWTPGDIYRQTMQMVGG